MKKKDTKKKVLHCAICGSVIADGFGNNPYPLLPDVESRCCDRCNGFVVEARIAVDKFYNMAKAGKKSRITELLERAQKEYSKLKKVA